MLLGIPMKKPWSMWAGLTLLTLSIIISWWKVGDYYKRRFGHADGRQLLNTNYYIRVPAVLIGLLFCYLFSLDLFTLIMPWGFFNGTWSSLGKRWYYLPFVPVFLILAFWQRNHSIAGINIQCLLFGVYLIVTGILDHRLLVRSLPGLRQESDA